MSYSFAMENTLPEASTSETSNMPSRQSFEPISTNYDTPGMREVFLEQVENQGFIIVKPLENQLLLDLDTSERQQDFFDNFERLSYEYPGATRETYKSKTPGHLHAIVNLPFNLNNNFERIAWQAILGSDPIREMMNLKRVYEEVPDPIVLFKPLYNKKEPSDG